MTIALPFHSQFDTGNDYEAAFTPLSAGGHGKDDTQMLPFFGITFESVFWVRMRVRLALFVIDLPSFQYFPYLFFRDMAAVHPAPGMTGEDKMADMPVDRPAVSALCLPAGKQHKKDRYYSEFHLILVFYTPYRTAKVRGSWYFPVLQYLCGLNYGAGPK